MTSKKDHGKPRAKADTNDLIGELTVKADAGYDIEETTLPGGYLLPEGTTMADVRRLELELLASEGLRWRELMESAPAPDEDFAADVEAGRKAIGPPSGAWPS